MADIEPLTRYLQGIEPALWMESASYDNELGGYRVVFMIGPGLFTMTVHVMPSPEWVRMRIAFYRQLQAFRDGTGPEPEKLESEG